MFKKSDQLQIAFWRRIVHVLVQTDFVLLNNTRRAQEIKQTQKFWN
jgi:hypothetical protein